MLTLILGIFLSAGTGVVVLLIVLVRRERRLAEDAEALLDYGYRPQDLAELRSQWRPAHREHDHHHTSQHATASQPTAVGVVPLPLVLEGAGQ